MMKMVGEEYGKKADNQEAKEKRLEGESPKGESHLWLGPAF